MLTNRALVFKAVPDGWPVAGTHLVVDASCRFDPDQAPPPGGLTIRNHYVSFDPYQRGRLRAPGTKSYFPPYDLGQPISNSAIATVLKSDHPTFHPGDVLLGVFPTEEYSVVNAERAKTVRKLDNPHGLDPRLFLGPLSMPGLTAYSSLYEIGKPTSGETLFVSAASGAVGQVVGQLAKHQGLRVIGSVGDDAKLDFITTELGFDGGFNYKKEKPLEALRRLAPNGIDIYYENVGGEQLEAALEMMNDHGRIVASGMVSQYNLKPDERYGIKNLMLVVSRRLTIRGFIVSDPGMGDRYAAEHQREVQQWLHDGTFKARLAVTEGMDHAVDGFLGMLRGKNFGKALLKIADLPA